MPKPPDPVEALIYSTYLPCGGNLWRSGFDHLTTFCEYWTSIKIRISMTCVSKEYDIIKLVQEEWLQLKMKFSLVYNMEII